MAHSLDDFSDVPLSDTPKLTPEAEVFVAYLEGLLDDDGVSYAADTLSSIMLTVRKTGKVTDPQRDAVANIVEGAKQHERTRARNARSRRYEGRHRW